MPHRFRQHYTREEVRALLPRVRRWLERLDQVRHYLQKSEGGRLRRLGQGRDLGGEEVNGWVRLLADLKGVLEEFQRREIQLKDLDRGLVDFPAFVGGKEVFLCWERDEPDVEYWHDLDAGYAGRTAL